jgi:hypothetical protein
MLGYLVAHPGRLVTKAEVLQRVWAGTHVSDSVLRRYAPMWLAHLPSLVRERKASSP